MSKHNGQSNGARLRQKNVRFGWTRLTVGNYYVDPLAIDHLKTFNDNEILAGVYCVTAPADGLGHRISAAEHLDHIGSALADVQAAGCKIDLPIVADNELDRGQDAVWCTTVIQGTMVGLPIFGGHKALNYTRQSWWDYHVLPWSGWQEFGLFPARYILGYQYPMDGPWADNLYRFRDYDEWGWWQFLANGDGLGEEFGVESADIDLDYCHLSYEPLVAWLGGVDPVPQPEPGPEILTTTANLNYRDQPVVSNASYRGTLVSGSQVEKIGESGGWTKVRIQIDEEAWMSSAYLKE